MTNDIIFNYNKLLENLSRELDISPSKYQIAIQRYIAVKTWLRDNEYEGCDGEPNIYLQGSFRLGTVVRPIREGKESDYDIDLVCQLRTEKSSTRPDKIKSVVGDRLKENDNYRRMLDKEGLRCWTMNYAEEDGIGFHLDVLPSTPEDAIFISALIDTGVSTEQACQAIAITHRNQIDDYSWSPSNPNGYADWFDEVKRPTFEKIESKERQLLLEKNRDLFAKADDVPAPLIKTPLQRAIQILKRHLDMRFVGHELEGDKPISMIVTTLSAKLYQNEEDLYSTLKNIIEELDAHAGLLNPGYSLNEGLSSLHLIERKPDGTWHISNPVNPAENFADRWHENNHRKARAFFQWVSWVQSDLLEVLRQADIKKIKGSLEEHFGKNIINQASSNLYIPAALAVLTGSKDDVPHIEIRNPSKRWGM